MPMISEVVVVLVVVVVDDDDDGSLMIGGEEVVLLQCRKMTKRSERRNAKAIAIKCSRLHRLTWS